jgi:hypothetical protein
MLTNMVKLDVNGRYRNLDDSKVYREINITMIIGCLDDELDNGFGDGTALRLKVNEQNNYMDALSDYMERNNIIYFNTENGIRYFELYED